jgi:hypothetical protein
MDQQVAREHGLGRIFSREQTVRGRLLEFANQTLTMRFHQLGSDWHLDLPALARAVGKSWEDTESVLTAQHTSRCNNCDWPGGCSRRDDGRQVGI